MVTEPRLETVVAAKAEAIQPAEPFLKWPGGKRALLPQLDTLLPRSYDRYFEPFLGGGALYFHLGPKQAVLSDNNSELVACYLVVRDEPERLIRNLRRLRNSKANYYRVRASSPRTPAGRAARLIYLVNLSFNGIYRVNFDGRFNVPYGQRTNRRVCDARRIRRASHLLSGATLSACDFASAVDSARSNDLVYLDPPYTVAHNNNGFIRYNAKLFSWDDQRRLAVIANRLAERGCHVIVSGAAHAAIRDLYSGFAVHEVRRPSCVSGSVGGRLETIEYVFTASGREPATFAGL